MSSPSSPVTPTKRGFPDSPSSPLPPSKKVAPSPKTPPRGFSSSSLVGRVSHQRGPAPSSPPLPSFLSAEPDSPPLPLARASKQPPAAPLRRPASSFSKPGAGDSPSFPPAAASILSPSSALAHLAVASSSTPTKPASPETPPRRANVQQSPPSALPVFAWRNPPLSSAASSSSSVVAMCVEEPADHKQRSVAAAPPPAPKRGGRRPPSSSSAAAAAPESPWDLFLSNAERIQKSMLIQKGNCQFRLKPLGLSGQRGSIFSIEAVKAGDRFFSDRSNDAVYIKLLCPSLRTGPRKIASAITAICKQHDQIMALNAPGIPILNRATIQTDGYIAVPRMARNIDLSNASDCEQVRELYRTCFAFDIAADAHNGWSEASGKGTNPNLMVDEHGKVFLIDYFEESVDPDELDLLLPKLLPTLGNPDRFDPRIVDICWNAETNAGNIHLVPQLFKQQIPAWMKQPHLLPAESAHMWVEEHQLGAIPLHTLKALYRMKVALNGLVTGRGDGTDYFLRARLPSGQIITAHFNQLEEFLNQVSNGNQAIRAFLSPL